MTTRTLAPCLIASAATSDTNDPPELPSIPTCIPRSCFICCTRASIAAAVPMSFRCLSGPIKRSISACAVFSASSRELPRPTNAAVREPHSTRVPDHRLVSEANHQRYMLVAQVCTPNFAELHLVCVTKLTDCLQLKLLFFEVSTKQTEATDRRETDECYEPDYSSMTVSEAVCTVFLLIYRG